CGFLLLEISSSGSFSHETFRRHHRSWLCRPSPPRSAAPPRHSRQRRTAQHSSTQRLCSKIARPTKIICDAHRNCFRQGNHLRPHWLTKACLCRTGQVVSTGGEGCPLRKTARDGFPRIANTERDREGNRLRRRSRAQSPLLPALPGSARAREIRSHRQTVSG